MAAKHSPQNSSPCPSIESPEFSTGGLVGALIIWGVVLAACATGMTDVDTAGAASARAGAQTDAATAAHFARNDPPAVAQRSNTHESDLPGASIAAYGN